MQISLSLQRTSEQQRRSPDGQQLPPERAPLDVRETPTAIVSLGQQNGLP
jgi:hypothetical protein